MASHWIKMRHNLDTDPKVIRIRWTLLQHKAFRERFGLGGETSWNVTRDATCDERRIDIVTDVTINALRKVWIWVNQHASKDAILEGVGLVETDAIAKIDGFGEAMEAVGWIEVLPNEEGLRFPNFHEHNTLGLNKATGAKSGAERTKKYRDKKNSDIVTNRDVTQNVTRDAREEETTSEKIKQITPPPVPQVLRGGAGETLEKSTEAEIICKVIKAQGVTDISVSDPMLAAYIEHGVPIERFENAARLSAKAGKGRDYMFGILKRESGDAANVTAGPCGPAEPWHARRSGVEAMAARYGIPPWDEKANACGNGESFQVYRERVQQRVKSEQMATA